MFNRFRMTMTFFIFIARAFISGAFQAAYVYTPEVRYKPVFVGKRAITSDINLFQNMVEDFRNKFIPGHS